MQTIEAIIIVIALASLWPLIVGYQVGGHGVVQVRLPGRGSDRHDLGQPPAPGPHSRRRRRGEAQARCRREERKTAVDGGVGEPPVGLRPQRGVEGRETVGVRMHHESDAGGSAKASSAAISSGIFPVTTRWTRS